MCTGVSQKSLVRHNRQRQSSVKSWQCVCRLCFSQSAAWHFEYSFSFDCMPPSEEVLRGGRSRTYALEPWRLLQSCTIAMPLNVAIGMQYHVLTLELPRRMQCNVISIYRCGALPIADRTATGGDQRREMSRVRSVRSVIIIIDWFQ